MIVFVFKYPFLGPPACTCNYTLSTSLSVTRQGPHRERLSSFASFLSSTMWQNDTHLLTSTFPPPSLCPPCTLCQSSTYVSFTSAPPVLSNRSLYAVCHCRHAREFRRRLSQGTSFSLIPPGASCSRRCALLHLTPGPTCCRWGIEAICCCSPAGAIWTDAPSDETWTVVELMIVQPGSTEWDWRDNNSFSVIGDGDGKINKYKSVCSSLPLFVNLSSSFKSQFWASRFFNTRLSICLI